MSIREIEAKSILLKHKKIDSWFISHYGMNLYSGCSHNCVYCDGRSEQYYTYGEFGRDVTVKMNAVDILRRELSPARKRTPFKRSFVMVGGGVGDSYQPLDEKYLLTRKALEVIYQAGFPVHVLTKSTLIRRDADILKAINERTGAIASFSFSSVDDGISAIFEPSVPPPSRRLETMAFLKNQGIACGMFLLPVIPFVTDLPALIDDAVRKASEVGVDFVIFGGMTLKQGRQKDYFMEVLLRHRPELSYQYDLIYHGGKWGEPAQEYTGPLNMAFGAIARHYGIPPRMPPALYRDILSQNDLVVVMLEHIDYLLKMEGKKSPFGYAAYSISQVAEPLSFWRGDLRQLKGVGPTTEGIIREILDTGRSSYYERLLMPGRQG
ncbi:MAG: radical SAM protein [Chloroflexi bacterium]|nr:radical SAM protein [Chloroflexota bacterium]